LFRRLYLAALRRLDPVEHARQLGVQVGSDCRLINVSFGSEPWLVKLGNHVSASDTQFITHDGGVWVFREELPEIDCVAPIIVGSNVFLGSATIVLPGVTIGSNVVVGAGSIVSRDIPSDCVAVGSPARPVRTLAEYRANLLPKCDPTKRLSDQETKAFYLQKYSGL
jgi:Acetyltransferase (isoleucine patch superfamily)